MSLLGWGILGSIFGVADKIDTQKQIKQNKLESQQRITQWQNNFDALERLRTKDYSKPLYNDCNRLQHSEQSVNDNMESTHRSLLEIKLQVTALPNGSVRLFWNNNKHITSYKVFRKAPGETDFRFLQLLSGESKRYTDKVTSPNTEYTYFIKAGILTQNISKEINSEYLSVTTFTPELVKAKETRSQPKRKTTLFPDFDNMDGHSFEEFCATLLKHNGFRNVSVTKGSGDQGIDIIAKQGQIKYGIQCKCYTSAVGNKAVQEVFSGKTFYNLHVGVVLTNNYFTPAAIELAEKNGVLLWNRKELLKLIKKSGLYDNSDTIK